MNTKLLLQGEYQIKVFSGDGTLTYASPVKKNFITTTGLKMISKYAIADCFRYLSIGEGTAKNSLTSNLMQGTTGLDSPIADFMYIGGREQASDPGHETSNYSSAGFKEENNTVTLYREWRVPKGEALFSQDYIFEEFMLSPGKPFTSGVSVVNADGSDEYYYVAAGGVGTNTLRGKSVSWAANQWVGSCVSVDTSSTIAPIQIGRIVSNNNNTLTIESPWQDKDSIVEDCIFYIKKPLKLCHCQEVDRDVRDTETAVYGGENSFVGAFYRDRNTPICLQTGAFTRVLSTQPVSANSYMTFTYSLQVTINSSHQTFSDLPVENSRPGDNWHGVITAQAAILHHGLKLISPGAVAIKTPWGDNMDQQSSTATWNADYEYGESFIPGWGCPLEPSCLSPYLTCYISSDRLQFAANKTGGAINPDIGFDGTDGLMDWVSTPSKYTIDEFPKSWYNIRIPNYDKDYIQYPDAHNNVTPNPEDYTSALPPEANFYLPESEQQYWAQANKTTVIHDGVSMNEYYERIGVVRRNAEISYPQISNPTQQLIANQPIRAIVLSFINGGLNPGYYIPYYDVLFYDKDLCLTIPKDYWDGEYYEYHLDILKNEIFLTPTWNYLETNAGLYFQFREIWGTNAVDCWEVDCP